MATQQLHLIFKIFQIIDYLPQHGELHKWQSNYFIYIYVHILIIDNRETKL